MADREIELAEADLDLEANIDSVESAAAAAAD